jgi:hypothetical protein
MLDRDTVIRDPHAATVTRSGGKRRVRVDDRRVSVAMQEQGATLTLFFEPELAWTGEAPLLELRLEPPASGKPFEPWRLVPRLPLHLQYARATLAHDHDNVTAALRALRQISSTRRGLSDDFLRLVAQAYTALVAEGEPHPIKALAEMQPVDKSTASRWVSAARERKFLPPAEAGKEADDG